MKTLAQYSLSFAAAASLTCSASAALTLLDPPSPYKATPESTANIILNAEPWLDPNDECDLVSLLRLDNLEQPPSGSPFTVSYLETGGNDDDSANVTWNLTGTGFHLLGVYVFGGSRGANLFIPASPDNGLVGSGTVHTPLTGKSGKFATISHLLFLGCADGGETNVPDGGSTAALLGVALGGLQMIRRKILV